MSSLSSPNDPDVLDGWKDIADYLGKSVRTAQRWRHEFGMPVHRVGGREGENVFAFRSELDRWRREASRLGGIAGAEQDADGRAKTEAPAGGARRPGGARLTWSMGSILLLAALGLAGWRVLERERLPQAPTPLSADAADRQPARWAVVGNRFHAYNAAGEQLWTYEPGPALATGLYLGHTDPSHLPLPEFTPQVSTAAPLPDVFIADLDGDRRREVLLIAHAQDQLERPTLHCLDADGSRRWTFAPSDPLVFGGKDEGPPARLQWVMVSVDGRGTPSIWVSAEHLTWYPTWVYRLDAGGEVLGRYGSNGRVDKIRFVSTGGSQFALLGGVNNERKSASVAIYEVGRFGGSAPAETPKYACNSCTPGQPDRYLLFPPTEVSRAARGMPFVAELAVQPSGETVVSVQQHHVQLPGELTDYQALVNYRLGADFRVLDAEYFTEYVAIHDHFASVGRLNHPFDARRESPQLWPVLRWNGSGYDRIEGPEQ